MGNCATTNKKKKKNTNNSYPNKIIKQNSFVQKNDQIVIDDFSYKNNLKENNEIIIPNIPKKNDKEEIKYAKNLENNGINHNFNNIYSNNDISIQNKRDKFIELENYEKAISITYEIIYKCGTNKENLANEYLVLGELLMKTEKYDEAVKFLIQAKEIFENMFGKLLEISFIDAYLCNAYTKLKLYDVAQKFNERLTY